MSGQGGIASLLPLIIMIAAAWFLLVRPQQQRAKQQSEMLSRLEVGAEIVTAGGIYGTIVVLGDERVRISVVDGSELEVALQSIRSVVAPVDAEDDDEAEDTDEAEQLEAAPVEDAEGNA